MASPPRVHAGPMVSLLSGWDRDYGFSQRRLAGEERSGIMSLERRTILERNIFHCLDFLTFINILPVNLGLPDLKSFKKSKRESQITFILNFEGFLQINLPKVAPTQLHPAACGSALLSILLEVSCTFSAPPHLYLVL